jgi:cell division ATPase FtsA
MVNEAIQRCDVDVRRDMWGGIVLTGGGALLPGLRERLEQVTCYVRGNALCDACIPCARTHNGAACVCTHLCGHVLPGNFHAVGISASVPPPTRPP